MKHMKLAAYIEYNVRDGHDDEWALKKLRNEIVNGRSEINIERGMVNKGFGTFFCWVKIIFEA